jgi:hypothetical protein
MPDFVDFTASLADDAANKVIGNEYLLGLELLGRVMR